jgi:hypothetical protein
MVFNPRFPITNPCKEIYLNDMRIKEVSVIDKGALVDGEKWYTVVTGHEAARWIKEQDKELWHEAEGVFSSSIFDIHNELLLFIRLKWPA